MWTVVCQRSETKRRTCVTNRRGLQATKQDNQEADIKENYISAGQHGVRKKRSNISNPLDFYAWVSNNSERRDASLDCVRLDCQKAFNTVPHNRVLKKLGFQPAIKDELLHWIDGYFTGREQRTHVRGVFLSWMTITSGVLQGSELAPLISDPSNLP